MGDANGLAGANSAAGALPSSSSVASSSTATSAYKSTNPFAALIEQESGGLQVAAPQSSSSASTDAAVASEAANSHMHSSSRHQAAHDPFELAELEASLPAYNTGNKGTNGQHANTEEYGRPAEEIAQPESDSDSGSNHGDDPGPDVHVVTEPLPTNAQPIANIEHPSLNPARSPPAAPSSSQFNKEPSLTASTSLAAIPVTTSYSTASSSSEQPRVPATRYAPPSGPPPDRGPERSFAPPSGSPPNLAPPQHPAIAVGSSSSTSSGNSSHDRSGNSASSAVPLLPNYHPSAIPTPGQPLLLQGRLLLYPPRLSPCSKCRGTGYKRADVLNPCVRCWDRYGRSFQSILDGRIDIRQYSLQAPLPVLAHHNSHHHHPHHNHHGGGDYPGAMSNASSLPQFQPLPHHGQQQFSPPSHPPPHPRLDPPQVTRTSEAEADEPDGEAPPSYEAVVTTHPNQTLPPQRVGEANRPQQGQQMGQGHFRPSDGGAAHLVPPGQSLYHYPYSQQHAYAQQSFPLHTGPPGSLPYAPYPHQGFPPQQSHPHLHHGSFANVHVTGPGRYPPPGALVLQPGDPRIGGRLCFHCDGTGTIEGLFFGDDICERCQGVGRLFAP